jgi:hypothetical protein
MCSYEIDEVIHLNKGNTSTHLWKRISEGGDGLQLVIKDIELIFSFLVAQAKQILPLFILKPYLRVTIYQNLWFLPLNFKAKSILFIFLLALAFAFQYFFVNCIQWNEPIFECMVFLLEADLSKDCDVVFPLLLLFH